MQNLKKILNYIVIHTIIVYNILIQIKDGELKCPIPKLKKNTMTVLL